MIRKLPLVDLAEYIRRSRRKHRRAIESYLNENVGQPPCGCTLVWDWLWEEGDWILPTAVFVSPVVSNPCKKHRNQPDWFDDEKLFNDLEQCLDEFRRKSNNRLDTENGGYP